MGADRTASSGKSRGCGPLGSGQLAFRRSGSLDCACRGALARPSRGFRELELSALSSMGQGWRVRSDLRGLVGRRGLRVRDRRWHHCAGAPARHRRQGRDTKSGHRAFPRRPDDQDRRTGRCAGQSRAVRPAAGHDSAGVAPLLTDLDFSALLADKAFDSDAIRADLDDRGAAAVIPPKANRVTTISCDFEMYKWRHLVENFFCKLKEFRRIATRYDKTDTSFSAIIQLVGSVLATR